MKVHVGGNDNYTARTTGNTATAVDMSNPIVIREVPDLYDGPTVVTPNGSTQTLATNGKSLASDITVNPIPSNYGLITWDGSVLTVS